MDKLYQLALNNVNSVNSNETHQVVKGIQNLLPASLVDEIARDTKLMTRSRKFSPAAFVYALIQFCSRGKVNSGQYTISNFQENFYNDIVEKDDLSIMDQKSFHDKLRKPEMLIFMTQIIERLQKFIKGNNAYSAHADLVKNYAKSLGITDIVSVDGCELFVRPSCAKNFNCKTSGKKRTQRGVQKDNAGIKIHGGFSNATGSFSHIDITEGVGSERASVNAELYPAGTLFIMDRGYIDKVAEEKYGQRGQFYIVKYRTNCQGEVISATNEKGEEVECLYGSAPSAALPDNRTDKWIDMVVKRPDDDTCFRLIRVRNIGKDADHENNEWSYYATNLPATHVNAFAVYLTYRCRWAGSEHSFKCLQSGNGMRAINSSDKVIMLTFILGNILSFIFKNIIAIIIKRIYKFEAIGHFSLIRIHLKMICSTPLLRALYKGTRSTIYFHIGKIKDKIIRACTRKPASKRDIENYKDLPTVCQIIGGLLKV